jgi:hypothetical protein
MGTGMKGSKERRPLVAGLEAAGGVERTVEKQFVYAAKAAPAEPIPDARELKRQPAPIGRVPLSTRIRADYATALKRASLERQLSGTAPNTLQDILEEALEPWLRANGYLN